MPKKYIIFAPSYIETSGGAVVLHKLCSDLNSLGYESYLYPHFETFQSISFYHLNKSNKIIVLLKYLFIKLKEIFKRYCHNRNINSPSEKSIKNLIVMIETGRNYKYELNKNVRLEINGENVKCI